MYHEDMKKGLWNKDFTLITASSILSAIGGEAIMVPVSLLVFDQTSSTFLSAVILVLGMLPDTFISIFSSPIIERSNKRTVMAAMEALTAVTYIAMAFLARNGFSYSLYVVFTLIIATLSVFYRLAYEALFIDTVAPGLENKAYSISSLVYPVVTVAITPISTILYTAVPMSSIFMISSFLSLMPSLMILFISATGSDEEEKTRITVKGYIKDLKDGLLFFRQEKGIRNIETYIAITSGASGSITLLVQAFMQSNPALGALYFGLVKSLEMAGRLAGGIFQYVKKIPARWRFAVTVAVYLVYDISDSILVFLPITVILLLRFISGTLGQISATIRMTATMNYLPRKYRVRTNAIFSFLCSLSYIVFQLLAGVLGEVMEYGKATLLIGSVSIASMLFLIVAGKKHTKPVYCAERAERESA